MFKKFIFCTLFLVLLCGCAGKSSNLEDQFSPIKNTVYRDSFTVRDKTIPLPPGAWKVIASGFDSEKFFQIYLLQEHPGKLFSAVYICVDSLELNRENGYIKSDKVQKPGMHHSVIYKNVAGEPHDWWYVNNFIVTMIPSEDQSIRNIASEYIKTNNLIISNDMIEVWHRLTGAHPFKKRYLDVQYSYNPEADGFAPGPKTDWKASDWNAMRVAEDPRKVEYIKELIKKNTFMHEKIKSGFNPS